MHLHGKHAKQLVMTVIGKLRGNWPRLLRLAGTIAAVQVAFWLLYYPLLVAPSPASRPDMIEIKSWEHSERLTGDEVAGPESIVFDPKISAARLYVSGTYATRAKFDLEQVPDDGLALLDNIGARQVTHYVNGELLNPVALRPSGKPVFNNTTRKIIPIAPAFLTPGTNTIVAVGYYDITRTETSSPPLLGEYTSVRQAFGWIAFLKDDARWITLTMTTVLAFLMLVVFARSHQRAVSFWLLMVVSFWAARSFLLLSTAPPVSGAGFSMGYAFLTLGLFVSWPAFADNWSGKPIRYFTPTILFAGLGG